MTQPALRQASQADQARRANATATSATPPPAHAIVAEAARKAPSGYFGEIPGFAGTIFGQTPGSWRATHGRHGLPAVARGE